MFRFESSHLLSWLILVPILTVIFYYGYYKWKKLSSTAFGERVFAYLVQSFSEKKAIFKFILLALCLTLMILSWARPQMGKGQSEVKSEGVEIMIAVDVSNSMMSEDVRPSRLEHAKKEVMRLLEMMSGDKVGLIAFAGSAVLLSPLTVDKSSLKMFVESLSPANVESQGTDMSKALQEAKDAFTRGGVEGDDKSRVTKVVVIISDGEDHEKGAEVLAKQMTDEGLRIFTMAVGTEAGGKIPLRDQRGQLRDYLKDKQGQIVTSAVKGDFLRTLASVGKGSFYHLTFGGDQMKSLKEDFDHLEKAEFDTLISANYDEKFQWLLGLALVLGFVELILGNRRKQGTAWKGRFPL